MARRPWIWGDSDKEDKQRDLKDIWGGWRDELDADPEFSPVDLVQSTFMWVIGLGIAAPILALMTYVPYFGWIPGLVCILLAAWFGLDRSDLVGTRVRGYWWPELIATIIILFEVLSLLFLVRPGLGGLALAACVIGFSFGMRYQCED